MNMSNAPGSYDSRPINALVSWRATIAGFVVAMMTFAALLALAIAFGGIGLDDGASLQNAGLAVVIATVISVFIGSYFAVRLSRSRVDVVGCSQGLVLGSLVILLVLWQTVSAVGTFGRAAAQATGMAAVATGTAIGAAAQDPVFRDMVEDNLGGTALKSEPEVVIRGLVTRIARGDHESARSYLAYQTGMSPEETDARIMAIRAKADDLMNRAREASATAMKASGWSVFVLIVLSAIASILGGLLGSQINARGALDSHNEIVTSKRSPIKTFDKPART